MLSEEKTIWNARTEKNVKKTGTYCHNYPDSPQLWVIDIFANTIQATAKK